MGQPCNSDHLLCSDDDHEASKLTALRRLLWAAPVSLLALKERLDAIIIRRDENSQRIGRDGKRLPGGQS
jgi:hypothetical protein